MPDSLFQDRALPHDEEAERGVLGSMMLTDYAAGLGVETLTTKDFYLPQHRHIFEVMSRLYSDHTRGQIDELIVRAELEERKLLESVGGEEYLRRIVENTPHAANIEAYAQIVRRKAVQRELIEATTEILKESYEPEAGPEELLELATQKIFAVAERKHTREAISFEQLMADTLDELARLREGGPEVIRAVGTGYPALDRLLGRGFRPAEFVILAGRPSMGKTTLALNFARHIAVRPREERRPPVAIFSLEMPKEQIAKNILCALSGTDSSRLRSGQLEEHDYEALLHAARPLAEAPIYLDDTPNMSIQTLCAKARRLRNRHGIELLIIDYLQLVRARGPDRRQEVDEVSRSIKALAGELEIPIVALSQLNRGPEDRSDHRPLLSDLRESGSLEQDADIVLLLYREDYYDADNAEVANITKVSVAKNRNGDTGEVTLTFLRHQLRFESYIPEHYPVGVGLSGAGGI